jgi:hypothetical protein
MYIGVKVNYKFLILATAVFLSLSSTLYWSFIVIEPPLQELVHAQMHESGLSDKSVWNQGYLNQNEVIRKKIDEFEHGRLCKSLKELDTKNLSHGEITDSLLKQGFTCIVRPIMDKPNAAHPQYLKKNNTLADDPHEKGVVYQEICQQQSQPDCVIRIKRDGFPRNRRSMPHSTKAVLIDPRGDPGTYDNEAFKIGWEGQAIPKGPGQKFGLRKCPYKKSKELCEPWVDAIMEEAHPALKEPRGSGG